MITSADDNTTTATQRTTLEFIYTTEFGDRSEIKLDLYDATIGSVFQAVRQALAGCGFAQSSIEEWFPEGE